MSKNTFRITQIIVIGFLVAAALSDGAVRIGILVAAAVFEGISLYLYRRNNQNT